MTSYPQGSYKTLLIKKENGVMTITMNRPTKKNAIDITMYNELEQALKEGTVPRGREIVDPIQIAALFQRYEHCKNPTFRR